VTADARDDAGLAAPPDAAIDVVRTLQGKGFEAYLVGGCVRDRFLGRAVNDWDVATDAEPDVVLSLFDRTIPTGLQHGTVTVMKGTMPIEVTTYRVEVGYSDGRRPDAVHYTRVLEDDLSRRDFTVNAMAWDPVRGKIVDPFAGRTDLTKRLIRAVGRARERFDEDGLRALRAVRFACVLDFEIEPETWTAIPAAMATFRCVSAERIRVEMMKIVDASRVGWGMNALRHSGLLLEFLPEVAEIDDVTWAMVVDGLGSPPPNRLARLAMVMHFARGDLEARCRALRFSKEERRGVIQLLSFRETVPERLRDRPAVKGFVAAVSREAIGSLLSYRMAVGDSSTHGEWAALSDRIDAFDALDAPLHPRELAIDGRAVIEALGVRPSRQIGDTLQILLETVWRDPDSNTKERLLEQLPAAYEAAGQGTT